MVLLTITPAMIEALQWLQNTDEMIGTCEDSLEPSLASPEAGRPISHGQVLEISQKLQKTAQISCNIPPHSLEHLLRGARVYVEPPKPKTTPVGFPSFI